MDQSIILYLEYLQCVSWQVAEDFVIPDAQMKPWLLEQASLSRRLGRYCHHLSAKVTQHHKVSQQDIFDNESGLLPMEACLLREVILKGDDEPWVLGRTLIPESTLADKQFDLMQQGNKPLGLTVFNANNVTRDALQLGWVQTHQGALLARRSRLWMNHKPMLVTELFLPNSPVYSMEECQ